MRTEIRDSTHWHDLRDACDANGSDVPILFGCGYKPVFTYWHQKKGNLPKEEHGDNERMLIGRHVEPSIASAASEKYGITLVKATAHYTDDSLEGMLGATPDYWLDAEDSDTVVEVKNASWGAYKDDWIIHEDGYTECPLRFQLQVQAQLACTGAKQALLLALISGDRLVKCSIDRHDAAIEEIRARVRAFHQSLVDNIEPPVDMPADAHAANRVWAAGSGTADMSGDPKVEAWLTQMRDLRVMEKQVTTEIERLRGDVQLFCKETGLAAINAHGGRISYKRIEAKPAKVVERAAQLARNELRITTA
jgi:predicted phage-related endonuclease